jgi:hypothetical protein
MVFILNILISMPFLLASIDALSTKMPSSPNEIEHAGSKP